MEISMVPILAKQAVVIKCLAHKGIIISNYECAYAMGLLSQIAGAALPEPVLQRPMLQEEAKTQDGADQKRSALGDALSGLLLEAGTYQAANEEEKQLLTMLRSYKPDEVMDEQVLLLLKMGYEETRIWER